MSESSVPSRVLVIAKEFVLWALRKRRPWRVNGASMEPDFRAGDLVLINPRAPLVVGSAIVARHPFKNLDVLKYVQCIDKDHVVLVSPSGDDSRQFGRVPIHTVKGTVTYNWKTKRDL